MIGIILLKLLLIAVGLIVGLGLILLGFVFAVWSIIRTLEASRD